MQDEFDAQSPSTPDCNGNTPFSTPANILADRDLEDGGPLGAGGFGAVKIGVHWRTREKYAIKRSAGEVRCRTEGASILCVSNLRIIDIIMIKVTETSIILPLSVYRTQSKLVFWTDSVCLTYSAAPLRSMS